MRLLDLAPRLKGVKQLICFGENYITFESDVLILPDTTYFGWRYFIDEFAADEIVAEHSFCKNTEEWGWEDETNSYVPDPVRELLEADLSNFKDFLSKRLGFDVRQWEVLALNKPITE